MYEVIIYNKVTLSNRKLTLDPKSYAECYNEVFNYAICLKSCFIENGILQSEIIDGIKRSFKYGDHQLETRLLIIKIEEATNA